ncbi:lysostaphin resistance A-like protein [Lactococcus hircilactis]|uniref:CPBP family intramembrane glutamic endopeptidase n=1 Tax=Lactococcus hircilactis TaxID=1494462 RepID=UPI0039EC24EC
MSSTILFASAHMVMNVTDWASWIVYLSMGLILGLIYYKTRSVECSIAVHMLWNLYAIFI